jgi:hypothetical protein
MQKHMKSLAGNKLYLIRYNNLKTGAYTKKKRKTCCL